MVDWFRDESNRVQRAYGVTPSVVAHSLGTYIVTEALRIYPNIRVDKLILCGSIVRADYPWRVVRGAGRVRAVLNDCGRRDIWAAAAGWFMEDAGASGVTGFIDPPDSVVQRFNPDWRHSDYFYQGNYESTWIPFLTGESVNTSSGIPKPPSRYTPYLVFAAIATVLLLSGLLTVLPRLEQLLWRRSQGANLIAPIVKGGTPQGDCQSESHGSGIQLFEHGWLVARYDRDVFYAIITRGNGLEWHRIASSFIRDDSRDVCAGVEGRELLMLGFAWWYCGEMPSSIRYGLGRPLAMEDHVWLQYQEWSNGLLIHGLERTQQGFEQQLFESLAAVRLENEATSSDGVGQWTQLEATATRSGDPYCTALWYPASARGVANLLRHPGCQTTINADHYVEPKPLCSIFGF